MRHGETEANRAGRIQGQDDAPLTPEGIRTARVVSEKLRLLLPTPAGLHVFCSPLPRARATLDHIRTHLEFTGTVSYDARLMEIDFGQYTGRPVTGMLPTIMQHKVAHTLSYPGGESGADLTGRVVAFLDEITRHHGGKHVLVITHFGVIETALRHYFGIPVTERIHPAHDEIHRITVSKDQPPALTRH